MPNYSLWLQLTAPELILSVSSLILLTIAGFAGQKSSKIVGILAVTALVASSAVALDFLTGDGFSEGAEAFYGQYFMDRFGSYMKLLIYAAAIITLIISPRFLEERGIMRPEFPVLIVFAAIGMGLMVSATDLLSLYIGLELNSLAAYVLASFARDDERSSEAGLKYFVLGALASGILLYGMSLLYGFTGTTNFIGIAGALGEELNNGALFGMVFVLAGLAFKISAVPFHMWTPDVYEGAPTPVTAFFASAPKVAAIALTMRVLFWCFYGFIASWQPIIIFIALGSIIIGAAGAIGQNNIKRLLAYSSINNVGFLLIGIAAATSVGASASSTYLLIYLAMTLGAFACIMELRDANGNAVESLDALAGLSKVRPGIAAALAMFMFSLAGIPPLYGFWGKFLVFSAAVEADLLPLAAIGIAASVIGAFYYLKVIKVMYFDDVSGVIIAERGAPERLAIIILTAIFISPLGYFLSGNIATYSDDAGNALTYFLNFV